MLRRKPGRFFSCCSGRRLTGLLIGVGLLAVLMAWNGPLGAAQPSVYAQLRLLMEALHEVDQKYVVQEKDTDLVYGAIRGMVMSLDSGSSFLTPEEHQTYLATKSGGQADAGLELALKDNVLTVVAPKEGGAAWKAGVRAGDHILKINQQSTRNCTPLEAAQRLQGNAGTKVTLHILRNGALKPLDIAVVLEKTPDSAIASQPLENGYYYLRVPAFRDHTAAEVQKALKAIQEQAAPLQGLIIDLRENASGTPEQAREVASAFLGGDIIYYTKGRGQEQRTPISGQKDRLALKGKPPLVLLVDNGTANGAEILAGALQNQMNAVLVGYKTFGLAALTRLFPLKDGSALILPMAQIYTPKGQVIQGSGLEPNVAGPAKESGEKPSTAEKVPPREPFGQNPAQDPLVKEALQVLKNPGKARLAKQTEPAEEAAPPARKR